MRKLIILTGVVLAATLWGAVGYVTADQGSPPTPDGTITLEGEGFTSSGDPNGAVVQTGGIVIQTCTGQSHNPHRSTFGGVHAAAKSDTKCQDFQNLVYVESVLYKAVDGQWVQVDSDNSSCVHCKKRELRLEHNCTDGFWAEYRIESFHLVQFQSGATDAGSTAAQAWVQCA